MELKTVTDWIVSNYAFLILVSAIISLIIFEYFRKKRLRIKQQPQQEYPLETNLFEDINGIPPQDPVTSLAKQKQDVIRFIEAVKHNARDLTIEEKELEDEFNKMKQTIALKKKELNLKYNNLKGQLKMIDIIIEGQKRLQESQK